MCDWQAGDLALCIADCRDTGKRAPNECTDIEIVFAPRPGTKWKVLWTEIVERDEWKDKRALFLGLAGQPSKIIFNSALFRKIDEREPDAEDEETIRLLKGAPVGEPVA